MKTRYHIGEMAQFFGISTDTLRIYDRMGILSPRKEANGYRVYSREDMIFLEYVLRLRQLGLSLKEVKELTFTGSIADAEQVLQVQSRRLLKRMEELYALYTVTQDYSSALKQTREALGEMSIVTSPRMILRPIDDSLIHSVSIFKQLGAGIMPWFCTLTGPNDILADESVYNVYDYNTRNNALKNAVITIDREGSVRIPESLRDEFVVLEPRKCIYMSARASSNMDYEAFVHLRKFVFQNGYTATGDMICIFIAVRCGARSEDDFYQVYLPIA